MRRSEREPARGGSAGWRNLRQRGATMVEFAIIAPIFFATVMGLFSAATYVFEVQVANQSAQAAARWAVATSNFSAGDASASPPVAPAPQCPSSDPPAGMITAAKGAAGPMAGSLTITDLAAPAESGVTSGGTAAGCEIQVTVPYVSFGGFFNLGPRQITATAVDYVT